MSEHRLEDCDLVLSRVHEFLDNELDTATADQIREHLLACEECVEHFDAEAAMRALISRCCQARAPPNTCGWPSSRGSGRFRSSAAERFPGPQRQQLRTQGSELLVSVDHDSGVGTLAVVRALFATCAALATGLPP